MSQNLWNVVLHGNIIFGLNKSLFKTRAHEGFNPKFCKNVNIIKERMESLTIRVDRRIRPSHEYGSDPLHLL